ncbi:MAG TPA: radical SAM protein [Pyrinomonadaceae bacterium]|nr:radical SAM protein [Pyrinomonadaceae bacterium]
MTGKANPIRQLTRFALEGIPQDAVCSVDVTNQCNLRCHHCYFFEHEQPENLAVERWRAFFDKLKAEGFPFFSCTWVGGEPLMRQEIIEMGSRYFRRNMVVTNGTIRIPDWPHVNFKVSVDGVEARHDRLRGAKTYQRIKRMIRDAAERGLRIGIATVLTRENEGELEQFVEEWKNEPINSGIIFEFYTYMHGQPEADKLWLNYEERDRVIDRLLAIKAKYPDLVECTTHALELLRSENCRAVTDNCLAESKMASWDVSGNRKEKCILGPKADCDRCGCAVPFWLHSFEDMNPETMGKMFGPAAGKYVKFIRPLKYLRRKTSRPTAPPPSVLHQISAAEPHDN